MPCLWHLMQNTLFIGKNTHVQIYYWNNSTFRIPVHILHNHVISYVIYKIGIKHAIAQIITQCTEHCRGVVRCFARTVSRGGGSAWQPAYILINGMWTPNHQLNKCSPVPHGTVSHPPQPPIPVCSTYTDTKTPKKPIFDINVVSPTENELCYQCSCHIALCIDTSQGRKGMFCLFLHPCTCDIFIEMTAISGADVTSCSFLNRCR